MASHKMQRVTEDIRRELPIIMRSVKDPRVTGMLSIVHIDLTNDLAHCTVYISSLDGMEHAKEAVIGLQSAAGYIRHEVGRHVKMRQLPEFHFVADNGIEYSANLNKKMQELAQNRNNTTEDSDNEN